MAHQLSRPSDELKIDAKSDSDVQPESESEKEPKLAKGHELILKVTVKVQCGKDEAILFYHNRYIVQNIVVMRVK